LNLTLISILTLNLEPNPNWERKAPIALAIDAKSSHLWILTGAMSSPSPPRPKIEIEIGFKELHKRIRNMGRGELKDYTWGWVHDLESNRGVDVSRLEELLTTEILQGSRELNDHGFVLFMDCILNEVFVLFDVEDTGPYMDYLRELYRA